MKRGRDDLEDEELHQNGASIMDQTSKQSRREVQPAGDDDSDLDEPVQPLRRASQVRKGHECPYLDTVSRQVRQLFHPFLAL